MDKHNWIIDIHVRKWISIISITDNLWIALIGERMSIKGLSFLPFHVTVGLLSSDLVTLMFWGPIHQMISFHDDVIKWEHLPSYWPFVRGIHWSPVNSPHKGQRHGVLMFLWSGLRLNKCLSKQTRRRWFETPSCSLWHHCYVHFQRD